MLANVQVGYLGKEDRLVELGLAHRRRSATGTGAREEADQDEGRPTALHRGPNTDGKGF